MTSDDATTPLGELSAGDQATIARGRGTAARAEGLAPGTLLAGRYRITSLLGRGGMGEVYRADDLRLAQPVALKFVTDTAARALESVYHEVRVARQVSHPNVCRVHDIVEADGLRFIAMEYVDGEDLASLLRRIGRLPPDKAIDVARDVAAGLAAAHDRGIVHRDLKPANVMIDGTGRARITDFGLASLTGSHDGLIAGTPAYMAPEQIAGLPVTPRTDVYALGLLLHELLTGDRVYSARSVAERKQQRAMRPRSARDSVKEVEPAVDELIAACLAEDPAERPASARAVLALLPGGDALDAAMAAGETPSPEMVAAATETGELPLRVVVPLLVAIAAGLVLAAWQSSRYAFTFLEKPPEVMVERAREIAALAGETARAADEAYFVTHDSALRRSGAGKLPREQLQALRPGIMRFVHRRAPGRLVPRESVEVGNDVFIFQSGRITMTDPPLDRPGGTIVTLDHHRGLVEYRAVPSGRSARPEWQPLLAATGVDPATLRPAVPRALPPVASDARAAWTARFPGRPEVVTIEAASLDGRPAWLRVAGPWGADAETSWKLPTSRWLILGQLLAMLGFTAGAVVMARRNLRRGRSDRAGAFRLAIVLGVALFAAWLVGAHHANDPEGEARMLAIGLGEATASGLLVWLFYLALEPGVRRIWPRSLIGWTRLLAGRARDAMVAREVLIGITAATVACQLNWIAAALRQGLARGSAAFIHGTTIDPAGAWIGNQLIGAVASVQMAIGTIFVALAMRKAFGRRGAIAAWAMIGGAYALANLGIAASLMMVVVLLVRSGLLTGATSIVTTSLLMAAPLTTDTAAWYWPRSLAVLLLILAAAAWAAHRVLPRRA